MLYNISQTLTKNTLRLIVWEVVTYGFMSREERINDVWECFCCLELRVLYLNEKNPLDLGLKL